MRSPVPTHAWSQPVAGAGRSRPQPRPGPGTAGFTLVEILTAVAITTIIVFALVSMFNTSTRALQTANRMTDVWETARATFGILKRDIGDVAAAGNLDRVHLLAANSGLNSISGNTLRLQDLYLLSREDHRWNVNVYLLGRDRFSEPDDAGVRTLYRFQTNYPVYAVAGATPLDIDLPVTEPRHPLNQALSALEDYLDARANGIEPDNRINVMARGIVHLRLVPYASDGRAFTNQALLPAPLPVDHFVDDDTVRFQGEMLPSSVDLEMFVLEPDRIEEFRSQVQLVRQAYLDNHPGSVQLFRTRVPIGRDLLARQ